RGGGSRPTAPPPRPGDLGRRPAGGGLGGGGVRAGARRRAPGAATAAARGIHHAEAGRVVGGRCRGTRRYQPGRAQGARAPGLQGAQGAAGELSMQEHTRWQDELIDRLVTDARPVRRLWRPEVRLVVWLAVVALVAVVLGGRFVRPDFARKLHSPAFLLEAAAMLVARSLLGLEALPAAVPGYRHDR